MWHFSEFIRKFLGYSILMYSLRSVFFGGVLFIQEMGRMDLPAYNSAGWGQQQTWG